MEDILDVFEDIEEEEFEIQVPRTRGPTIFRARVDHYEKWNEVDFFARFRMRKRTANIVLGLIREHLISRTNRNRAVSPDLKFLCALRFYASGSFLINVGELNGLHKSTVSKIVKQVSVAIARLCPQFIKMVGLNTAEEVKTVNQGFFRIAKFPNCVGAIDCTHVKIQSPGGEMAELYRNRKNVFSINVQAICDARLILCNIVARWPGSTHDSHIFNSSRVKKEFQDKVYGRNLLVGDSGYACTTYLIPPLDNVSTPEEQLFQESQIRTRNPIERCFGVWKRRFPVLSLGIRLNLDRVESIIVATAVLHNICVNENEELPPMNPELETAIADLEVPPPQRPANVDGRRREKEPFDMNTIVRYNLINRYYKRLLNV